jgi:EmrB/QacA subfamily drug resistance transporter
MSHRPPLSSAIPAPAPAAHHPPSRAPVRANLVLTGLSLAILLSQLGTNSINVGLPTLVETFSASFGAVQWVVVSYLLVVTALIVGVGRFSDQLGKKRLYLAGLIVFLAASVVCALAPNLTVLIAGRISQGLGGAVIMALSFAFVGEVFPKHRMGFAMGILSTMVSFGIALGPSLGSLALSTFGWRAVFWLNLPFGVLAYLLIDRALPAHLDAPKHVVPAARFDWSGTLLLAATLTAYSLAMTFAGGSGFDNRLVLQLLAGAAAGLALFLAVQVKSSAPLLRLAMFRNYLLSSSMLMSVLVYAVMMATLVLGPFFLAKACGLDTRSVGLIMTIGPLVAAVMGVPAGWCADKIGARLAMAIGLGLFTSGAFLMSLVSVAAGVATYVAAIVPISVGLAFFQTPNNTAVMADAHADQRGLVSGLLALARNLGLVTGASLMGALFAHAVSTGASLASIATAAPDSVASAMQFTFRIATAMAAVAFVLALTTLARRPR